MKKALTTILTLVLSGYAIAQVGINTTAPIATLDVMAKNTNGTTAEGIMPPRMTGDQIKMAENNYTNAQIGVLVFVTSPVTTPSAKTAGITSSGLYSYNGTGFYKMAVDNGMVNYLSVGDVKSSIKSTDHDGWYIMDGRDINSLPVAAQNKALSLGFVSALPDGRDKMLKGKSIAETAGSTGGSNSLTLLQENLPNINMSGSVTGAALSSGAHTHPVDEGGFLLGGTVVNNTGTGNYTGNVPSSTGNAWGGVGMLANTAMGGSHIHFINGTAIVPSGGTGVQMDNRSAYLAVSTFVYLGQ